MTLMESVITAVATKGLVLEWLAVSAAAKTGEESAFIE